MHILRCLSIGFLVCCVNLNAAVVGIDDHIISATDPTVIAANRTKLIDYIWGQTALPADRLPEVAFSVQSPFSHLQNVRRVDCLTVTMEGGLKNKAYHFISQTSRGRLVIVHHGHHWEPIDDYREDYYSDGGYFVEQNENGSWPERSYGMQRTVNNLLREGYSVLYMMMPPMPHEKFVEQKVSVGHGLKFFLDPLAVNLNYLKTKSKTDDFPVYSDFSMIGLSGGGWTTAIYSALDSNIKFSFPVSGTQPLYLWGASPGDLEQWYKPFYTLAGYPDLYVMGSYGTGRKQVQIRNRDDPLFSKFFHPGPKTWEQAIHEYEVNVRQALVKLGAGSFRLDVNEADGGHTITWNTVAIILAELDGGYCTIGSGGGLNTLVRGIDNHLWRHDGKNWQDTGITSVVGIPAVLEDQVNGIDVFYRSEDNMLTHVWYDGKSWSKPEKMNLRIMADPVVIAQDGKFDLVALNSAYRLAHFTGDKNGFIRDNWAMNQKALGIPSLVYRNGQLHVFYREFEQSVGHIYSTGTSWCYESIGGTIFNFPSAVCYNSQLRVFAMGEGEGLFEAVEGEKGKGWAWHRLSCLNAKKKDLAGSPSATTSEKGIRVYGRTGSGSLSSYSTTNGADWSFLDHGGMMNDSPKAKSNGCLTLGNKGLCFFNDTEWISYDGLR